MRPMRASVKILLFATVFMAVISPVSSFSCAIQRRSFSSRTALPMGFTTSETAPENDFRGRSREALHNRKKQWIDRSVNYYSKVMREKRRRNPGQLREENGQYREEFVVMAKKHYFALFKIKSGNLRHAERIYRNIIDELLNEEDGECDHAKLAVTTLLLALLLQRTGDIKGTRAVFLEFIRTVVVKNQEEGTECACSAKVLGAYALFEMKNGHSHKSLEIAQKATEFDPSLAPVLKWKQFRDVPQKSKSKDNISPSLHPWKETTSSALK